MRSIRRGFVAFGALGLLWACGSSGSSGGSADAGNDAAGSAGTGAAGTSGSGGGAGASGGGGSAGASGAGGIGGVAGGSGASGADGGGTDGGGTDGGSDGGLCTPSALLCVGNDVHSCNSDGLGTTLVTACNASKGEVCAQGSCLSPCALAAQQRSTTGCEFWAVDLDQQDAFNDPASAPLAVTLSNPGLLDAVVTVEINTAPVGSAPVVSSFKQLTVKAGATETVSLGSREVDCGTKANDYAAPGTCLSSNGFRITSTQPIAAHQFNPLAPTYSNDGSLLLPLHLLGTGHRILGWGPGHPIPQSVPGIGTIVDRAFITVVGTAAGTKVKVKPSFRLRGNPPIAATAAGTELNVTLGAFDVLNLESDDAALADPEATRGDLSGSWVESDKPVAVFSGVESAQVPGTLNVPTPPGWVDDTCCLDHIETQIPAVTSLGTDYVISRSPVRAASPFLEADVLRFVGGQDAAQVSTNLPTPFDSFTLQPGEVKTTWTQGHVTVSATKPIAVGQLLVSAGLAGSNKIGDPALTQFPAVTQFANDFLVPAPSGWTSSWLVITHPEGATLTLDGGPLTACTTQAGGTVKGIKYQVRTCSTSASVSGAHRVKSDKPVGVVAYGYDDTAAYAIVAGARL
ncbi:MAG: IgGFc-binding protein [Polyangiaceae bacterium]